MVERLDGLYYATSRGSIVQACTLLTRCLAVPGGVPSGVPVLSVLKNNTRLFSSGNNNNSNSDYYLFKLVINYTHDNIVFYQGSLFYFCLT